MPADLRFSLASEPPHLEPLVPHTQNIVLPFDLVRPSTANSLPEPFSDASELLTLAFRTSQAKPSPRLGYLRPTLPPSPSLKKKNCISPVLQQTAFSKQTSHPRACIASRCKVYSTRRTDSRSAIDSLGTLVFLLLLLLLLIVVAVEATASCTTICTRHHCIRSGSIATPIYPNYHPSTVSTSFLDPSFLATITPARSFQQGQPYHLVSRESDTFISESAAGNDDHPPTPTVILQLHLTSLSSHYAGADQHSNNNNHINTAATAAADTRSSSCVASAYRL